MQVYLEVGLIFSLIMYLSVLQMYLEVGFIFSLIMYLSVLQHNQNHYFSSWVDPYLNYLIMYHIVLQVNMDGGNAVNNIDWNQVEAILFSNVGTDLMDYAVYTEICQVMGLEGLDVLKNLFEEYLGRTATRAAVRERLKNYIYTFFGSGDIARVMLLFDLNIGNPNLRSDDLDRICIDIRKAGQCNDVVLHVIQSVRDRRMTYREGAAQLRHTFELLGSDPLGANF
ncbi:hypothetical protein EZV62_007627 [Acer yangbiense]|uniref:Uncharacterized protein n=1 Tax=Acer yangbiense TaxID=1000413 RepID=A0A5C7IC39_9ROSI|nr:hypothetical protein EZV62_007627 [Acer yangbiense]